MSFWPSDLRYSVQHVEAGKKAKSACWVSWMRAHLKVNCNVSLSSAEALCFVLGFSKFASGIVAARQARGNGARGVTGKISH
jgi:hypothetical protein